MTSDSNADGDIDPERRTAIKTMGFFGTGLTGLIRRDDGTPAPPAHVQERIREMWEDRHRYGRGKWCRGHGRGKGQEYGDGYERDHPHFDDDARWRDDEVPSDGDREEGEADPELGEPDTGSPDETPEEDPFRDPDEGTEEDGDQEPDEDSEGDQDETDVSVATRIEMRIHEEVNDYRQANGLDPLVFDDELAAVARAHSQDMNDRDYLSHVSPDGDGPGDRLDDAGIDCNAWAENIALEYDPSFSEDDADSVAESIVAGWISSPGHRQNILGDYDEQGIGVDIRDDGRVVATQLFCSSG